MIEISGHLNCIELLSLSFIGGRGGPVNSSFSSGPEGPGSRLVWRNTAIVLIAPGAYKNRRGCNVLQVPIQVMPFGVPKRSSRPLRDSQKL